MKGIKGLIRLIIIDKKAGIITIVTTTAIILAGCIAGITMINTGGSKAASVSSPEADSDSGGDFVYVSPTLQDPGATPTNFPEPVIDDEVTSFKPATKMDLDPSSLTVYVNKEYCLPKDYKPDDLITPNIPFNGLTYDERTQMRSTAAKAIERLFAAGVKDGVYLYGVSGYRSYERQWEIFTNNIATQGKEHTLKYSAVPGTSEHQTGLAMDVSTKALRYLLDDSFADSVEGKWLAKNAYKYGFIIRYPKDKAEITGYAYEPWHIRYVGRGLSYYLYHNHLTLDEYYHYTPDPNFNFEALYADIINYVPPSLTPSVTPTQMPVTIEPTLPAESVTPTTGADDTDNGSGNTTPGNTGGNNNTGKDHGATPAPSPTSPPSVTETPAEGSTDSGNGSNNTEADNSTGTTSNKVIS